MKKKEIADFRKHAKSIDWDELAILIMDTEIELDLLMEELTHEQILYYETLINIYEDEKTSRIPLNKYPQYNFTDIF